MSLAFRSFLVIVGIIVWFMLNLSWNHGVEARIGRGALTVHRWYMHPGVSETPYQDCPVDPNTPVIGRVTRVEVVGCDTDPCVLHRGTNATFKLNFIAQAKATEVHAIVHGVIGSVPIPFHIPHDDACTGSGITCPIQEGKEYTYSTSIPVLKSYPGMSVKVKWELRADKVSNLVCVVIPAKIG